MHPILAQTETSTSEPAATETGAPVANPLGGMMPMILIVFAIFYFMSIRPNMRKDKERKKQIEQLRAGTKVSFGGGIIGVISEVKEFTFMVKIADNTVIEIARGAINSVIAEAGVSR